MTLKYPPKLAILSISARWLPKEHKYYFAGWHILQVNWNRHDGWLFGTASHVGSGLDIPYLKLKSLANSLDPERHLICFNLQADLHQLNRIAILAPDHEYLRDFESALAACLENSIDPFDQFGAAATDIHTLSAQLNEAVFRVNKSDEDQAWQAPGLPSVRGVKRYLAGRNAFIWLMLMRLTLSESQLSEALAAYSEWQNAYYPRDIMRDG